jgi:hypothetical protein
MVYDFIMSNTIQGAQDWSDKIKKRFSLNGEHKGVYFFPILNEALQHIESLSGELSSLKAELSAFANDLQRAPEIVRYEKNSLLSWLNSLNK